MSQPEIDGRQFHCLHAVQFYEEPALLADAVARYVAEGLRLGEAALIIAKPQLFETIERALRYDGWPVPSSDLKFVSAVEMLERITSDSRIDPAAVESELGKVLWQITRGGRRPLRIYGEMVTLLCERGLFEEAERLEELWNVSVRSHPISLLCAYPISQFNREGVAHHFHAICDAHDRVLPTEEWFRLDAQAQLRRVAELERQAAQSTLLLGELKESVQNQAEAHRQKDEFLAMLGHELRNPLAPIFTALELMTLRGDSTNAREREVIHRQALHLTRLVDDLLDVSRLARGKIKLAKEPVEIADLVPRAVEVVSPLFEERRHHLKVSVARGLVVEGDAFRLSQVLANLLGNAAKYTEPGGQVSVTAVRDGLDVVVEVVDNGNGIPSSLLSSLFDLFVQGDQAIDRAKGGLGLGLSLVKNLTQLHGGSVSAHSDGLGRGSTFVVRIPALDPTGLAEPETVAVQLPPASDGAPVRRILLVDDNEDAADVMAQVLRMKGCDVTVAHDGPEAVMLARTAPPDIALLDLGLPIMDGYELAGRLRQELGENAPKLIAVTGYGQERDRARTREAGFIAHLVKPVGLDDLLGAIERA
jgi:signal transduction histidine kinase